MDFQKKVFVSVFESFAEGHAKSDIFALVPPDLIQLEQRRFKYPVDFRLNDGTEYLVTEPGDIMYTGKPSPEIDRAWNDLLWGRYFSISEEEAKRLWGDRFEEFRDRALTGFTAGYVYWLSSGLIL